jgi:hypothetical protein
VNQLEGWARALSKGRFEIPCVLDGGLVFVGRYFLFSYKKKRRF